MGHQVLILHILLGVLTLCSGQPADGEHLSATTATSFSPSTVTRRHFTTLSTNTGRVGVTTSPEIVTAQSVFPVSSSSSGTSPRPSPHFEDNVTKIQKIKKKILASNLRNVNDRMVLPNDRAEPGVSPQSASVNVTQGVTRNPTQSTDIVRQTTSKSRHNETAPGDDFGKRTKNNDVVEGRSLESRSSLENSNTNLKKRIRFPSSATEVRTTHAYSGETFGVPQRPLNNNYLSEGERSRGTQLRPVPLPSPSSGTTLPTKPKPTPVSTVGSVRNAVRFEPTSQANWVPIVPEQMSTRLPSTTPVKENKTFERQTIVFPSDGVQPQRESNDIPVRDVETEKTTVRMRNDVEKTPQSDVRSPPSQLDLSKLPIKFRGSVKYKPGPSNVTTQVPKKHQMDASSSSSSNHSFDSSEMEIPATGATWTLATLKASTTNKYTDKMGSSTHGDVTPTPLQNSTNAGKKSQNSIDNSVVVPPESIKMDNVTKDHQTTTSETTTRNVTGPTSPLPRVTYLEAWSAFNKTDVAVPESVAKDASQTPVLEVLKASTPKLETTITDMTATTADDGGVTTEMPRDLFTSPKVLQSTVDGLLITDAAAVTTTTTSQRNVKEAVPLSVTPSYVMGNSLPTTDDLPTTAVTAADYSTTGFTSTAADATLATSPKAGSFEDMDVDDGESYTEVEPKPMMIDEVPKEIWNGTTASIPVVVFTPAYAPANSTVKATHVRRPGTTSPGSLPPVENVTDPVLFPPNGGTTGTGEESPDGTGPTSTEAATIAANANYPLFGQTAIGDVTSSTERTNKTTLLTSTTFTTRRSSSTTEFPFFASTATTAKSTASPATTPSPPTTTTTTAKPLTPATSGFPPVTTTSFQLIEEPATTEESIYYKNYIPTTINPRDEITEENVPAYLRLTVQAASWTELCSQRELLRDAILRMLDGENVTSDSIHFLNLSDRNCQEKIEETRGMDPNGTVFLPVNMFLMDKNGDFDKNLSEAFLTLWGRQGLDFDLPIRKVDFVTPIVNLTELAEPPLGGSVVAAIVISCVAGICVILLGILFVIMKRRQKRFNYGQRCTPVSLDAYSLDSVSIYNSVRRKGMRASKRSYGNAAFDDPEVPSHPMNFAGLANFSSGKEQLYEEFNIIPQVYPKTEELPEGAETKNRYANVIPLPETRVHLTVKEGDPLSDYINANYVRGNKGQGKLYIACQGPMESTIEDFWRMVWEQQCKVIMMVTDLQENGKEKCADYLPPNEVTDNLRLFGDFQVTLKKRDVKEKYIISNLTLKNMDTNLWREVTHLWYLGWPDQGVPPEANSLIAFLIEARSQMKIQNGANTSSPAVVHCSPGTGRTGTVIACDLCIREYEQTRMVDIPKCVFNLRRDRAGAVQTKDQYAFIYQVLNVYATKITGGGIESI